MYMFIAIWWKPEVKVIFLKRNSNDITAIARDIGGECIMGGKSFKFQQGKSVRAILNERALTNRHINNSHITLESLKLATVVIAFPFNWRLREMKMSTKNAI